MEPDPLLCLFFQDWLRTAGWQVGQAKSRSGGDSPGLGFGGEDKSGYFELVFADGLKMGNGDGVWV